MNKSIFIGVLLTLFFSCKKEVLIYDSIANENIELPLLLNLDGKDCSFDSDKGILKYSINAISLLNYSPVVKFQSYSEISIEKSPLVNNEKNELGNLELNKPYELVIKSNGESKTFSLIFTNIPIVQIVANDPIANGPKILSRLILKHPEKSKLSDKNWVGIEHRGASSLKYDKKSFGFEVYPTNNKSSLISRPYFDLKSNYRWALTAQFKDPSRARNKVSFDLWNSISGAHEHVALESRFVEVFVNNKAFGIYSFSELFSESFLSLSTESVFYEGTDNSSFTTFDALPEKSPKSSMWEDWEQKFVKPPRTIFWDDFELLSELIVNGSNSKFKNTIGQVIDLDNVIDYYLFVNLCRAADNVGKNWCFLKRNTSTKFIIVPYDLDGTWGRSSFGLEQNHSSIITNRFFKRLIETNPENYNLRLKNRWNELRLNVFSTSNLKALFELNKTIIAGYNIIDFDNTLWGTNLNLEIEQDYIETWLDNRLMFLDAYFN